MRKNKSFTIPVLLFVLLHPLVTHAQVRLPQLIADHMVLQRDVVNPIWGWAAPAEKITLSFNGRKYKAIAAADGSWQVRLPATRAGGPYTLDIRAGGPYTLDIRAERPHSLDFRAGNHFVINDILFGDVWFCSGQSNMVLPMERVKEKYPEEVAQAEFPMIRNFFVPTAADVACVHEDLPPSKWVEATPKNVLAFGAATWFFAKALYLKYHIPIGIINSSVGGMPIQAWISAAGLKDLSVYADRVARFRDSTYLDSLLRSSAVRTVPEPAPHRPDLGLAGPVKWYDSNYVPSGWHKFWLPGFWADQGVKGLNGVVWFRKEIEVPPSMAGKPAKLFIGRIIDADETYVNGVKVGNITYQYPPRRYDVPAGLLKAGKNILTVRVTNTSGKGGFEPDKRYEMYHAIAPKLRFKALSLPQYEAQIALKAGAMVSQGRMRVEGDRPRPIEIGGHKVQITAQEKANCGWAVVRCHVCDKVEKFLADTPVGAVIEARKAGWMKDPRADKEICAECAIETDCPVPVGSSSRAPEKILINDRRRVN